MAAKLGILAGSGELPLRLIEACRAANRPVFVIAFEGFCDPRTVEGVPHQWMRLGAGGGSLQVLRANSVEELVMAGGVRRPSFRALRPDWRATRFFLKIGFRALAHFGDDALFRAIIAELEIEGFRIVGVDSILGNLLAPLGALGARRPDDTAEADIRAGIAAARAHGARDLGQAVIVRGGTVKGVEERDGTDALLRRAAGQAGDARGGVLVKLAKPHQERRVDLPAIGPATTAAAAAAGLSGVAVEAGATFVLDRAAVIAAADSAGLFVVGVKPS
jgi:UDP-2,3-diacylglucosamine hydrolase